MGEAALREEFRRLLDELQGNRKRPGASAILVTLAGGAQLFHDAAGDAWITFPAGGHRETHPLRSKATRAWLAARFYRQEGRPPGSQALADALDVLEARARFDGPTYTVYVRIAEADGRVYVDLGDPSWRAVEIDRDGWRIISNPPVKFWRPRGLLPLPEPERGGSLDELREFVNADDDSFTLVVAWLVGALRPRGPYPILALEAEQGAGKSTLARMLRALIDPHEAALRRPPRDERDLFIAAANGWTVAFDNLSGVPAWLSDALCVLATGGAFSARALYTDREETLLAAQRPVILTGIEDLAVQPDLRDRTVRVELRRLDETRTLDEATLWERFEQVRPRIFGALLNAVSAALRHWDAVRLDRAPRMADFARWVVAAESGGALPWETGTFLELYREQRTAAAAAVLDDPLSQALLELVGDDSWSGTATDLLRQLGDLVDERVLRSKVWPKTAAALSNRLKRLAPELRRGAGVEVEFDREGKDRRRVIRLVRSEQGRRGASAPSAASAESENPDAATVSGFAPADAGRTLNGHAAPASSAPSSAPRGQETVVQQAFAADADDADEADADLHVCSADREEWAEWTA